MINSDLNWFKQMEFLNIIRVYVRMQSKIEIEIETEIEIKRDTANQPTVLGVVSCACTCCGW